MQLKDEEIIQDNNLEDDNQQNWLTEGFSYSKNVVIKLLYI